MSKNNSQIPTINVNTLDRWHNRFRYMEGQLLTIIDASVSDKTQREAVKSLVRNTLFDNRLSLEVDVRDEKIVSSGSEPLRPFKEN